MVHLKRPYIAVRDGTYASYGGSQQWLEGKSRQAAACGLIAAADVLLYLRGERELTREEYLAYLDSLRRYFPLIPYRGIDGVRLAVGLSRCLRAAGLPYRARWCASGEKLFARAEEMLERDIPVILSIGPNLPAFWRAEKLTLYRRTAEGAYLPAEATRAHFVTVTGLDGEYLRISSWGRQLFIRRTEYERYQRRYSAGVFTNLVYLEQSR